MALPPTGNPKYQFECTEVPAKKTEGGSGNSPGESFAAKSARKTGGTGSEFSIPDSGCECGWECGYGNGYKDGIFSFEKQAASDYIIRNA
uniref:HDC19985 n=1 Tax=Drosophila melanogaster TaxID=7227 RepID=Q6II24_DROME|nr:TPA_inf: HDC19985 [Drosophila melanogaster]